jgi:hypothetical protein
MPSKVQKEVCFIMEPVFLKSNFHVDSLVLCTMHGSHATNGEPFVEMSTSRSLVLVPLLTPRAS